MEKGGKVRREGKIVEVKIEYNKRRIDFGDGDKEEMKIKWGDVEKEYKKNGIKNIEVFIKE